MARLLLGFVAGALALGSLAPVGAAAVEVRRTAVGTPSVVGTSTIADLVDRVDAAVVSIDTVSRAPRDPFYDNFFGEGPGSEMEKGVGSGFVIDPNGLIVTNNHVIEGATNITVTVSNNKHYAGKVVGTDPATDLALVRVNAKGLKALAFAKSDAVRVGDWVVAIGSPLGLSHTVSVGIVSALNREIPITERGVFLQTDAAINPGNSGGPLINMQGQVVGVSTAIAQRGQNIGFAIPSWVASGVINQLRTRGRVARPYLGVSIRSLAAEEGAGVLVVGVVPNGPAAKAGLHPGDLIVRIDGKPVKDSRELVNLLLSKGVGQTAQVTVSRDGRTLSVTVPLEEMPEQRGR